MSSTGVRRKRAALGTRTMMDKTGSQISQFRAVIILGTRVTTDQLAQAA